MRSLEQGNFRKHSRELALVLGLLFVARFLAADKVPSDELRCVTTTPGLSLCKLANDGGEYQVVSQLKGSKFCWNTFSGKSFEVVDALGNSRLLAMVDYLNASNGVGFEDYGVYLFSGSAVEPVTVFSSADWSPACINKASNGTAHVYVPEWVMGTARTGTVNWKLVVRPFILQPSGELIVSKIEPIRVQRLTEKFDKVRNLSGRALAVESVIKGGPVTSIDPLAGGAHGKSESGVIEQVKIQMGLDDPKVTMVVAVGGLKKALEILPSVNLDREIARLGDASTRRLFPQGYVPLAKVKGWLGKAVKLTESGSDGEKPYTIIWM